MALNLAIIVLFGLIFHFIFARMNLPGLLGVLLLGIVMGPHGADLIDESIMNMSDDLRKIALVVILLRAGLGINRKSLEKIGLPALKMGVIPTVSEGLAIMLLGILLLDFTTVDAGMLGFIIAAASPAIIVPKMLEYIHQRKGETKGIPTMILAGVSLDDVVAITLFSGFAGYYGGQQASVYWHVFSIPLAVITGVLSGALAGIVLVYVFRRFRVRDTKKTLIVLATAILFTASEARIHEVIPFAALLGVMVIGFTMMEKNRQLAVKLADKLNKIWVFSEILLFFLVGVAVNPLLVYDAGLLGLGIIIIGLFARSAGVYLALAGSNLSLKERNFCVMAYWPKATVQAAIGAVPLSLGVPAGEIILAFAVLSIMFTAPLGAIAIHLSGEKVLT